MASAAATAARVECDVRPLAGAPRHSLMLVPMKTLVATLIAVILCAGCASGGADASGAGTSRIEMYGTIDQGVTIRN
ncbi:hypothetical protein [Burkholderia oklahomensis]|uniref:hypothetical protein n=1 Tax=Burkholderia oklahomensis TaxID=342113 RepID=UPI00076C8D00|nr:hypothetical protein [Burkholderia oklahomensis]AOI41725.1 hypothetical protein WG70_18795 [Burkholderia oklahomensis EO147]KUY69326.1 hypothetical protein WG70_23935 [Burkholderia oklahomensis EO147]QPS39296.1 hypothetical protein I6G57_14130 [Burkholderia oklahomensis]